MVTLPSVRGEATVESQCGPVYPVHVRSHLLSVPASKNSMTSAAANRRLPFVLLNIAMTADGKIAPASRRFVPFGSPLRPTTPVGIARHRRRRHGRRAHRGFVPRQPGAGAGQISPPPPPARPGGIQPARHRQRPGPLIPEAEIFRHRFSPIIILTTAQVSRRQAAPPSRGGGRSQSFRTGRTQPARRLALAASKSGESKGCSAKAAAN